MKTGDRRVRKKTRAGTTGPGLHLAACGFQRAVTEGPRGLLPHRSLHTRTSPIGRPASLPPVSSTPPCSWRVPWTQASSDLPFGKAPLCPQLQPPRLSEAHLRVGSRPTCALCPTPRAHLTRRCRTVLHEMSPTACWC